MAYFPFFVDLTERTGLLVGGGTVALRKAEKLLPYGATVTAVSGRFQPQFISVPGLKLLFRPFADGDIAGRDMVIAATDDRALNAAVAEDCNRLGIPVNSVDAPSECSFYFPAVITEGNVTVAVSTGGASPALAAALKRYIASRLHENLNEICKRAETLRGTMPAEEYAAAVQKLLEDES